MTAGAAAPAVTDPATMRTAVLAVLGGVSRTTVARRLGVADAALATWVDTFIESGSQGLIALTATGHRRGAAHDRHLAMVAHELRSPLTMITGWAGLIAADPEDADLVRRAASGISAQAIRLRRLADDSMDASAVALGAVSIDLREVRLSDVIHGVADARAVDAPLVDIREDALVHADAERLGQVIDNLLENARKHAAAPASIGVTVVDDGSGRVARITVTTAGHPIAPEQAEQMFQPWARGTTAAGGAGLGLYICRSLVEAHGGQIGLDVDEQGNTFWITLPVA